MERKIDRSYAFSEREIREALLAWLKAKDLPAPAGAYENQVTWTQEPRGLRLAWSEQDEM